MRTHWCSGLALKVWQSLVNQIKILLIELLLLFPLSTSALAPTLALALVQPLVLILFVFVDNEAFTDLLI
jgi:hypothetical protein